MRVASRRDGFALPMTLFLISILTLMLTAAFAKVQADRRVAESSGAAVTALALAKAGLNQYLGARPFNSPGSVSSPWRPPNGDSVRITLGGGYADVIAHVVRRPQDPLANWLYVIRSVGHVIDPSQGADPQAVRTIAQFAQWQSGRMDIKAAYTAANAIATVGGSGCPFGTTVLISGYDAHGGAPTIGGERSPSGSPNLPNFGCAGGTGWATLGSPSDSIGASEATVARNTNIDWLTIVSGGFNPDYRSIQTTGPDQWNYSSQLVFGDDSLDGSGSGLLMVTGDLYVTDDGFWNGIILVGGRLIIQDEYSVRGALFTGLNEGLVPPINVPPTDLGNYDLSLIYHSEYVRLSLAKLTGFAPIPNGWVDNWAVN